MASAPDPIAMLNLWRETIVQSLRRETPDLTTRQFAILLTVYLTPPPHTVRGLAAQLHVSKPAVTRALDRLGLLDLARRKRDDSDRRNVLVQRTVKGSVYLREFADATLRAAAGTGAADA
ncbi:MAG: MarR family transcriptional regulator [Pseudomonadota bacterium]